MRPLIIIPLLALFAVPSGIDLLSRDLASRSNQSPSASETAVRDDKPSRVSTTPENQPASPSTSVAAAAAADPQPAPRAAVSSQAATTSPASAPVQPEPAPAPVVAEPESDFITQMEEEILRLTNEEREAQGLSPLSYDAKLRGIAAGHSADMLENDYFSHDDQDGCSSSCRASGGGYRWRAIGENIYMMSGFKLSPEKAAAKVVDGWMDSPGHKANILGNSFTESGVGVVHDGKSIYVTAMYGKER